jgi:hypothetical protein
LPLFFAARAALRTVALLMPWTFPACLTTAADCRPLAAFLSLKLTPIYLPPLRIAACAAIFTAVALILLSGYLTSHPLLPAIYLPFWLCLAAALLANSRVRSGP